MNSGRSHLVGMRRNPRDFEGVRVSRTLKFTIGFVISAVAVWFSMRDVRPTEVWNALRQASYLGFFFVCALTIFGFWLRAFRWRWLLSKRIAIGSLFSATMIGFMANNLLPLRLGEFVRAWALGRREHMSKSTVFATVGVERVLDMLTLLIVQLKKRSLVSNYELVIVKAS